MLKSCIKLADYSTSHEITKELVEFIGKIVFSLVVSKIQFLEIEGEEFSGQAWTRRDV